MRNAVHGVQRVFPYVVTVVGVALVKANHGKDFRPEYADNLRIAAQNVRRARALDQFA